VKRERGLEAGRRNEAVEHSTSLHDGKAFALSAWQASSISPRRRLLLEDPLFVPQKVRSLQSRSARAPVAAGAV
jgi:hypothetical protein